MDSENPINPKDLQSDAAVPQQVVQPPPLRVIQLFMSARNLKNLDQGRDKSDTQVVLKMKWHANQKNWSEVDHTEVIHDNLSPSWSHHFDVIFNFGQNLALRFEINDLDSDGSQKMIGYIETTLTDLVKNASSSPLEKQLAGEFTDAGYLSIKASEKRNVSNKVHIDFQAIGLPECQNVQQCNFSTTYFMEIYRGGMSSGAKIYESDFFVDDLNHRFSDLCFTDAELCGTDAGELIGVKFINRNQYKMENKEIACAEFSIDALRNASGG